MTRVGLALALAWALTGCAGPAAVMQSCLPLKPYTAGFQAQAAAELAKLPPEDPLGMMIVDYGAMRGADRACLSSTR